MQNEGSLVDQYFFDIPDRWSQTGKIVRHADSNIELRRSLYNIASHFASPEIVRLLADAVLVSPCQRSRYEALRSLKNCDPAAHDLLSEKLRGDPSPILQAYFRQLESE
jgi:hypothetical protein